MLKKIRIADLRLGMYLHGLCGPWLDHPFWKSRFVLVDPGDLLKLRASGGECWIDSAKGLDLEPPEAPLPDPRLTPRAAARGHVPAPPRVGAAPAAASMEAELTRAGALVRQSRQAVMALFNEARLGRAIDAERCQPLVDEITESVWRNPGALISLARLKTHDDYSYMHSVAVCALMVTLARQLGHDEAGAREAGLAGLLHDIGKAAMPLDVLNKPGKLTEAEFDLIKSHPQRGHEVLLGGSGVPAAALNVCLHHHERPDGKGYPFGACGAALALEARMGAVCDVYDAITSNRPYKAGWDPAESIARMADWSKAGQFDTAVFAAFVKSLGIYPTGSLVRLQSGRLGVVVEHNEAALVKPRVRVFFSTRTEMPVARELIDLNAPACTDSIVGRESNREWQFNHLDEMWAGREALAGMVQAAC